MHNVENAVAAIAIAHYLKIDSLKIKKAVADFKGVKRRFEYIIAPRVSDGDDKGFYQSSISEKRVVFIDDYAHHPRELEALLKSAKSLFGSRKCIIIFQPHLFSRTRDLAKEFAEILDMADEVLLLPIYPARELPIVGVTSRMILDEMKNKNARLVSGDELLKYMRTTFSEDIKEAVHGQLLITAGAGDIDQFIQPIQQIVTEVK
jgi:UDP-N-acetylmuramate--alanine ligase